jgi:aspartyl-tRNA(Asn)/glutamyl-tRNA(Gln) amidotransferase subunit C
MTLTLEEVEHIAGLARLSLTEEEKNRYRVQLSAILDYAARLQEIDTEGITPTSNILALNGRLRDDAPKPGLTIGELLENAPDVKNSQFRVPPVLDA